MCYLHSGGAENEGSEPDKKKPVYFEWAKKVWETEDTFKLPDGTYWPHVSMLPFLEITKH